MPWPFRQESAERQSKERTTVLRARILGAACKLCMRRAATCKGCVGRVRASSARPNFSAYSKR